MDELTLARLLGAAIIAATASRWLHRQLSRRRGHEHFSEMARDFNGEVVIRDEPSAQGRSRP